MSGASCKQASHYERGGTEGDGEGTVLLPEGRAYPLTAMLHRTDLRPAYTRGHKSLDKTIVYEYNNIGCMNQNATSSNYMYCNFLNKRICAINSLYNFIFKKAKKHLKLLNNGGLNGKSLGSAGVFNRCNTFLNN